MFGKRRLACSFCGKSAANVGKLVAGRRAYICDVCAAEVQRIMDRYDSGPGAHASGAPSDRPGWLARWAAVKSWLSDRRRGHTFAPTRAV